MGEIGTDENFGDRRGWRYNEGALYVLKVVMNKNTQNKSVQAALTFY